MLKNLFKHTKLNLSKRNTFLYNSSTSQCCKRYFLNDTSKQDFHKQILSHTISDTQQLASKIAPLLKEKDILLLIGEIGSGKSVFARHAIRLLENDMTLDVPSPTFLLDNIYETKILDKTLEIHHIDLYRLDRMDRLDLPQIFENSISLIEWGDRLLDRKLMSEVYHLSIKQSMEQSNVLIVKFEYQENSLYKIDSEEKRTITLMSKTSSFCCIFLSEAIHSSFIHLN
ncbi:hypothetical protein ABK040_015605 [Willaertia magna]